MVRAFQSINKANNKLVYNSVIEIFKRIPKNLQVMVFGYLHCQLNRHTRLESLK